MFQFNFFTYYLTNLIIHPFTHMNQLNKLSIDDILIEYLIILHHNHSYKKQKSSFGLPEIHIPIEATKQKYIYLFSTTKSF